MPEQDTEEIYRSLQNVRNADAESVQAMNNAEHEQVLELKEKGKSFGHPSYVKYMILFGLAVVIDLFGLLDLSGVGWFFSKFITIPCFIISITICWFTNTRQKQAQNYLETLSSKIHQYGIVSKFAIKKTAKFFARNPQFLIAIGEGLDVVLPPVLSLINLSVVWVYIAYRSEKRAFQNARESADSISI